MRKSTLRTAIVLFASGLVGIASLLLVTPSIPPSAPALDPNTLRWISLINPTILLTISVTIGMLLKDAAGVSLPILALTERKSIIPTVRSLAFPFLALTTISAIGVLLIFWGTKWGFDQEYKEILAGTGLPFLTRILYGGITEEILMRFGVMTLMLWILKEINRPNSNLQFWCANLLTAGLFATGHLPALLSQVSSPSFWTLAYILGGNFWAGLCFGYAFWRYGLGMSILTHIGFHLLTYYFI